jgi:hypothetical protein
MYYILEYQCVGRLLDFFELWWWGGGRRVAAAISRLGGENMVAYGKVGRATAAIGQRAASLPIRSRIRGETNRRVNG